ncbi:hypothetical protein [Methanobrevibacter sp.]|uniref:hypothetical protein n=1 Tax=Methanobrevibacter sp. TaxID=66852 RepID=UPI003870AB1C
MNKKIMFLGVLILTICISISVVSAEGFEWSFSTSESSNSDGDAITFDNGKLVIQDIEFSIPDGYKEVDNEKVLGANLDDDDDQGSLKGFKISADTFKKGNDIIVVKVVYSDTTEGDYTPDDDAVTKTISNQEGWLTQDDGGVIFTYIKDKKIVEIVAPDEETVESVIV